MNDCNGSWKYSLGLYDVLDLVVGLGPCCVSPEILIRFRVLRPFPSDSSCNLGLNESHAWSYWNHIRFRLWTIIQLIPTYSSMSYNITKNFAYLL